MAHNDLIFRAAALARRAHDGQTRKFSTLPYIVHPARVAGRVLTHAIGSPVTVAAAFVHDVVEDCDYELKDIERELGTDVAQLTHELTAPSTGMSLPRAERKKLDRDFYRKVSHEGKVIKLLDRIDNVRDMFGVEDDFAQLYMVESRALGDAIGAADRDLHGELNEMIDQVLAALGLPR